MDGGQEEVEGEKEDDDDSEGEEGEGTRPVSGRGGSKPQKKPSDGQTFWDKDGHWYVAGAVVILIICLLGGALINRLRSK